MAGEMRGRSPTAALRGAGPLTQREWGAPSRPAPDPVIDSAQADIGSSGAPPAPQAPRAAPWGGERSAERRPRVRSGGPWWQLDRPGGRRADPDIAI